MSNTVDHITEVSEVIYNMLTAYNTGITEDQFYSLNILDATDVSEDDMRSVNDGVIEYCKENGCYAALPPFEEGAFIDHSERRYTHWKVLDVCEDYFRLQMDHYPIIFVDPEDSVKFHIKRFTKNYSEISHPCWYRSCRTIVKVKLLDTEEHMEAISRHPDIQQIKDKTKLQTVLRRLSNTLKTKYHVGGVIESYEYYTNHDLKKIMKKGKYSTSDGTLVNGRWIKEVISDNLSPAMNTGLTSILFCSSGPIIEMFVYINYLLSQKSTSVSTLRTVSSRYIPGVESIETRKERHFGKLKVISEKKPKAVNDTNIQRVYTTISWQRRSHLRHLPSGKIIPIKSAICKRHNLGEAITPQVVYKV